jgi:O-antigen ligase
MTATVLASFEADVRFHHREARRRDRTFHATALLVSLVFAALALSAPASPLALTLALLVVACLTAMARPVLGIHIILFLTLAGDSATVPWWPFIKNLSSRESLMFVSDKLSVTPMELVLIALGVGCFAPALTREGVRFRWGALARPMVVIALFLAAGFVRGHGGIRNVAIMEVRPLLYLVALYLLIAHVFTKRAHYHQAIWVAIVATSIQGLFAVHAYRTLPDHIRDNLDSLAEHSATVQMNGVFLFALGLAAFGGSRWQRRIVAVLSIPVVFAFFISQRRGAMVALFAGAIILLMVLFHRNRARFWAIAPVAIILAIGYIGATWNASGALGLPASAVKSVFFTSQLDAADQSSNLYRDLEAINVWYTIRASPVLGQGFGQPFIVVAPMPNIGFFEFWQYFPHNSVLWVWIKIGFFGFVAVMYTIARAAYAGARSVRRVVSGDEAALVVVGLGYVVMFTIFAYVDIAITGRPAVFLALCIAICADFDRLPPARPAILAPVDPVRRQVEPAPAR